MTPEMQGSSAVREAHPEVIFASFAGVALRDKKTTLKGKSERLRLLVEHGLRFDAAAERARLKPAKLGEDDLIDAAACLVTAQRIHEGRERVLPDGDAPKDGGGLRMEIVA